MKYTLLHQCDDWIENLQKQSKRRLKVFESLSSSESFDNYFESPNLNLKNVITPKINCYSCILKLVESNPSFNSIIAKLENAPNIQSPTISNQSGFWEKKMMNLIKEFKNSKIGHKMGLQHLLN